jgi:chromate transporter
MEGNIYLLLLSVFVPLSLLSVGGGQSILPEMHRQIVEIHGLLSNATFLADFAISKMAPGPTSLIVTLIGYQVAGWFGAIVASFAIFVPSSILMLALARIWSHWHGAAWRKAVEMGMAPVAAGLILASTVTLARGAAGGWLAIAVAVGSAALMLATEINPLVLIGGGASIFLLASGV